MNDKKYNDLDVPLHEVTIESIRQSKDEKERYKKNLLQVLDIIINHMKSDEVFKCLYQNNEYTGSSYENLKINKPNEFDINLLFLWPASACEVVYDPKQPGYVKLKINLDDSELQRMHTDNPSLGKKLNKWIDRKGFFLRNDFTSWMQGMITKALNSISVPGTEIKLSRCGPANTLKISQRTEQLEYSVDLVPAFQLAKNWPKTLTHQPNSIECKEWTIVPKEPKSENVPVYWRMSFYMHEKKRMNDHLVMKDVMKLIKLLRDHQKWSDLNSYVIKTVFLWECESTHDIWKNSLGSIFIYMLQKLADHFKNGIISYFWDQNLNLIEKMKEDTKKNIYNRINAILKQIESNLNLNNPFGVKILFGCSSERTQQSSREASNISNSSLQKVLISDSYPPSTSTTPSSLQISRYETESEKEKINVDMQNRPDKDLIIEIDSVTDNLLSLILTEQQMIKQYLHSLSEHCKEISNQVRELKQENASLRKHLQNKENEDSAFKLFTQSESSLLDLKGLHIPPSKDQKCSSCSCQLNTSQENALAGLNTSPTNFSEGINTDISLFSDLVSDHFTKYNVQSSLKD